MIDTLKYAQRIETELGIDHQKAASAAFIARDMIVDGIRELVTKSDLELVEKRIIITLGGTLGGLMMALAGVVVASIDIMN